ncbi:MAG: hypothetical protein AABZ57_00510, partial [Candidatus Margulisiibacteriota bacterium]
IKTEPNIEIDTKENIDTNFNWSINDSSTDSFIPKDSIEAQALVIIAQIRLARTDEPKTDLVKSYDHVISLLEKVLPKENSLPKLEDSYSIDAATLLKADAAARKYFYLKSTKQAPSAQDTDDLNKSVSHFINDWTVADASKDITEIKINKFQAKTLVLIAQIRLADAVDDVDKFLHAKSIAETALKSGLLENRDEFNAKLRSAEAALRVYQIKLDRGDNLSFEEVKTPFEQLLGISPIDTGSIGTSVEKFKEKLSSPRDLILEAALLAHEAVLTKTEGMKKEEKTKLLSEINGSLSSISSDRFFGIVITRGSINNRILLKRAECAYRIAFNNTDKPDFAEADGIIKQILGEDLSTEGLKTALDSLASQGQGREAAEAIVWVAQKEIVLAGYGKTEGEIKALYTAADSILAINGLLNFLQGRSLNNALLRRADAYISKWAITKDASLKKEAEKLCKIVLASTKSVSHKAQAELSIANLMMDDPTQIRAAI